MRLATSLRGLCNRYATALQLKTQLLNIFIAINHTPFHLWRKKKSVKYLKVSKYCDHRCRFRNCTHIDHGFSVVVAVVVLNQKYIVLTNFFFQTMILK